MTCNSPRLLTLIAELTYSCPLRCAYCSNPTRTTHSAPRLSVDDWSRLLDEAAALGALHVHFTGGEPLLHEGLELLVERARYNQLYTNLITSGLPLTRERLSDLVEAGLDHVQLSFQGTDADDNARTAGLDATGHKLEVARWVKSLGVPLTINIVVHRQNIANLEQTLAMVEALEPHRIELANAQYLGWALHNRDQLLPSARQLDAARRLASAARRRLMGKTDVLFVLPDYYADRPRACMQGWGSHYLVVSPDGLALPCHAARGLPDLSFDDVRSAPLSALWANSKALCKYRGSDWLPKPCRSCDERERDFGGCRCQAFALTGDSSATDPSCALAPSHAIVQQARTRAEASHVSTPLVLRRAPTRISPSEDTVRRLADPTNSVD